MASLGCTINGQKGRANAYTTTGGFYCGVITESSTKYYNYCLKFTTPTFSGTSSSVTFKINARHNQPKDSTVVLRYALCSSDANFSKYQTSGTPSDSSQIKTGTVSFTVASAYSNTSFTVSTTGLKSATTYYLIIYSRAGYTSQNSIYISASTNHTATLNYTVPTYTVTYDANGGTGAPAAQTKTQGTALTLSTTKPTKASVVTNPTGTITISYNANGGSSTPSAGTGTYTDTKTQPYSFSSWNTQSNGSGTNYASGGSYTTDAAVTLYAQYTAGTATTVRKTNPSITTAAAINRANGSVTGYKVSFNSNGSSATAPTAITSDKTRKYTFSKWNTNSDGSGTDYTASTAYTFSASDTLYAKWTSSDTNNAITLPAAITRANASAGSYTITFNTNGGTSSTTTLSAARTTSYTFGGWNTNSGGTGTNYNANASYTPTEAVTLYAKWNSSTSTAAVTLPTPTRSGYKFIGWAETSDSKTGITGSYTPSKNLTLYAIWEPMGLVYIHDGTSWSAYQVFIHNGTTWEQYAPYINNGTNWEMYS